MTTRYHAAPAACVLFGLHREHEWQCAYMAAVQHAELGDGTYEFELPSEGSSRMLASQAANVPVHTLVLQLTTDEDGVLHIEHAPTTKGDT